MDEAKEKHGSLSIATESSVTVSETVVGAMACEGQIQIEEGGEGGSSNGDDIMVEVLGSHVYVDGICTTDGEDGGLIGSGSNDEAVHGNLRSVDSEVDAAGDLGSRSEVSSGVADSQNVVNGAGVEGSGASGSSTGGEAGENAERTSGMDEGGEDANQAFETRKVCDLDGNELNHGNQKAVVCSSAASEDASVKTNAVEEAAMMIDGDDLNTLDGARVTVSDKRKKAADVGVDAKSSDAKTHAEDVPHSDTKDPVYSCQSNELVVESQLDKKVNTKMEIDKQGTDYEKRQMEVNTPHQGTGNHSTGYIQSLKTETAIDSGEQVDLSMGKAMDVQKNDAEQDVKVQGEAVKIEAMIVGTENHRNACQDSESLGHLMDVFVGSDGGEASKVDDDVSDQISPSVASDKLLHSTGNEDQLAKNAASEDDSSVGLEMNVEELVTGDEQDGFDQEKMEVEEHDTDSEQPVNIGEKTVKRTGLRSASAVKVHQARYQLLSKEEGEFSVSDLVWGKVRSHPWWPGQIFDPSDASEKAVKHHKKDSFLVAYFGDRTFAWNEASLLKPFRSHFSQIEKQSNSESFQNAVSCALEEVSRRAELGLACTCVSQDACDMIKFQKVENTGVRQGSNIRDGVDASLSASSFEPDKLVDYMKALAESPTAGGDRLDLVIAKAQLLAFYRLKGYHQLPEFQSCRGLSENETNASHSKEKMHLGEVMERATPMDMDGGQVSTGQETSKTQRSYYLKRKHNLKDGLYPSKKERSLSELMVETLDSPDAENGSDGLGNKLPSSSSGKKRKSVDSFEDSVQEGRKTISLAKVSLTTPHFPKPSFKIGECIRRAASQMTGSPSILKPSGDRLQKLDGASENPAVDGYDVPFDNFEDAQQKRMNITTECSSLDELLSQLHLAACDPMNSYSSFNNLVGFFSNLRDSVVVDQHPGDKAGGKRKKSPNSIIGSPETFEFEDMNDTYWTDRVVQNGSEEQPSHGNGRGQYQIVPVELGKPVQKGRKSRKRYSDVSHDLAAQKPPGYVDERAPAELVMNFSEINSVPSETKLNKMFKHFGPLKESETEVDRETSRARVVFRRSSDAEIAYNSAGKFNIFGPVAVNYQLNYTISESFKASLYAPTLAEENPLIASAICGNHALVDSTLGEETSLVTPSLGEEASFMVSTLDEETLPIAASFHEESSFISSTLGEGTLAIPTTLGDGTTVIGTTMYEETLPIGTTMYEETLPIATSMYEETLPIATTMYEQTLPIATTMYEQTLPIATTSGEGTTGVATTIGDQTFTVATTVGEQSSTIATTMSEHTLTVAATSVEEASLLTTTLSKETSTVTTTLGEETSTVNGSLGEEASSFVTLRQETSTIPAILGEETTTVNVSLGEETSSVATLDQETSTTPTTLGEEISTVNVGVGEETSSIATIGQETSTTPTTLGEETSTICTTLSEETSTVNVSLGEETSSIATLGQETSTVPTTLGEETSTVNVSLCEETSSLATLCQATSTVPTSLGEKTATVNVSLGEETSSIATLGQESSTISTALGEETATVNVSLGEETSSIATLDQETSTTPTTLGEETPTYPVTLADETASIPRNFGEETPAIRATFNEETPAIPPTFSEETPSILPTFSEETSTIPVTLGQETQTIPSTMGEETLTITATLGEETTTIPTTLHEETLATTTTLVEETLATTTTLAEETPTITTTFAEETPTNPTTLVEETPTNPTTLGQESSIIPATLGEETSTNPTTSGEEASTVLTTNGEETSTVSMTTETETLPPAVAESKESAT